MWVYVFIRACAWEYVPVCVCESVFFFIHRMCIYIFEHIYMHVYMCEYVCVDYMDMCVYTYVCIYVYVL